MMVFRDLVSNYQAFNEQFDTIAYPANIGTLHIDDVLGNENLNIYAD